MLTFLRPGDALVHSDPIYGGTEFLVTEVLPEFGVHVEFFRSGVAGSEPPGNSTRLRAQRRAPDAPCVSLPGALLGTTVCDLDKWLPTVSPRVLKFLACCLILGGTAPPVALGQMNPVSSVPAPPRLPPRNRDEGGSIQPMNNYKRETNSSFWKRISLGRS